METKKFLETTTKDLFKLLEVDAKVSVKNEEDNGFYVVEVTGEDIGYLIGFKGSVINSFQSFLYLVGRRKFGEEFSVQVDVNGYREKRIESLKNITAQVAQKIDTGQSEYKFGRLTPYERRIIHSEITENYPNLVSYSVGEGSDRRLVVAKAEM
jgi:spoIIIJ-associated protein